MIPPHPPTRHRSRHRAGRHAVAVACSAALVTALGACGTGPSARDEASTPSPAPSPVTISPTPSSSPTGPATATDPATACVAATTASMSREQQRGQLVMVGFDTAAALGDLDAFVMENHVGNVIYLGGWNGADKVARTSRHLQGLVSTASTAGVGLMIAADQEGGEVHQLRGDGFTRPPAARDQARMTPGELTAAATGWARELRAAGVNVNLAPVTDTVPESIGRDNKPIGRFGRQYGSTPKVVERASLAFLRGMLAGGVEGTVKHFPGLGRIRNNTDFDSSGITDGTTTVTDPYLRPFAAGIEGGAGLVMVGSATYTKLDAGTPAMFSAPIVTDLLRGRLGYDGVVVTDDLNAAAVRTVPVAERAIRFVAAGGDLALTGKASHAPRMLDALAAAETDAAFAAKVDAAVERVLRLKYRMGLLPCSPAT